MSHTMALVFGALWKPSLGLFLFIAFCRGMAAWWRYRRAQG